MRRVFVKVAYWNARLWRWFDSHLIGTPTSPIGWKDYRSHPQLHKIREL